ncbi:Hypothetical predicted protein [Lecanosticta acicola]|uniref:Queuosine 5'-phosphate N-glycosylase/hydrolase n=1 Tax=Lecanosticta acicola TaxID=111012 RepID=A0AAI9EA17_9PEZI|nr:Hypothetical predicted protein [Lecanosticta acicola]
MSDDEADPELLELLRQSLGISQPTHGEVSSDTGVLRDAEYIYSNAIDVSIDMYGTKAAAAEIYKTMQEKSYSTETWSEHELHPKMSEGFTELDIVNFVFTMDLLNFSFWSELSSEERFQVEYRGKRWTGYNSLVASLRRALDESIPITTPRYWRTRGFTDDVLQHVFRSATAEPIPLLEQRMSILREAGDVLRESFGDETDGEDTIDGTEELVEGSQYIESLRMDIDGPASDAHRDNTETTTYEVDAIANGKAHTSLSSDRVEIKSGSGLTSDQVSPPLDTGTSDQVHDSSRSPVNTNATSGLRRPRDVVRPDHAVVQMIQRADQSAGKLVNLLAKHFECFRDETRFDGRRVRLLKRAQIFVADLWAALNQRGLGEFVDIGHLTMFADYRVPQALHSLGVLTYSPPLDYHLRDMKPLRSGHSWEVQLRGCSIWAVELLRREIVKSQPEAANTLNAVLIDFFLYDLAKERERAGIPGIPTQRTRSIWY